MNRFPESPSSKPEEDGMLVVAQRVSAALFVAVIAFYALRSFFGLHPFFMASLVYFFSFGFQIQINLLTLS